MTNLIVQVKCDGCGQDLELEIQSNWASLMQNVEDLTFVFYAKPCPRCAGRDLEY